MERSAISETELDPSPALPWQDLATMALVAHAGELRTDVEQPVRLSACTARRLDELAGPRPQAYWEDLIHYGQILGLFRLDDQRWGLPRCECELLGATRRECAPALGAAWMKSPAPMAELDAIGGSAPERIPFRMELLNTLGSLASRRWYNAEAMAGLLGVLVRRHGLDDSPEKLLALARALPERVLLVLGIGMASPCGQLFMVRGDNNTPPAMKAIKRSADERSQAYRQVLARTLGQHEESWRSVEPQLQRCIEVRRARQADNGWVRLTESCHDRLEADPRLPFSDCLFLARLGQLIPQDPEQPKVPGHYVFELEAEALAQRVREGLPLEEIASFLQARCERDTFERLERLLNQVQRTCEAS